MSGLKSAWEISLEKSDEINPELKAQKKLDGKQKKEIAEVRKEYEAQIADKEVTLEYKIKKLIDRISPEQLEQETVKLKDQFAEEKQKLEKEAEEKILEIRKA